ncbi:MAG: hypothetical protein RLZZ450_2801 [Pseudomonadota bacterium]|jgi:hypothetical protein
MLPSNELNTESTTALSLRVEAPLPGRRLRDSGFYGELQVRTQLRQQLPSYQLYANPLIPSPACAGGTREADIVLVGFNGVFVIEVKNWTGTISGRASDRVWEQRSRHAEGYETCSPRGNAVSQARAATEALREVLRQAGYVDRVQGIVVFSHPKVRLALGEVSLPFCTLPELAPMVLGFGRIAAGRSIAKRVLRQLLRDL